MLKAKDIMTTDVTSVTEDKTLQDVIELMSGPCISGLPVVDKDHKVVGVISDTDIVRYSQKISVVPLANLSGWISPHTDVSDLIAIRKGRENLHHTKVSEVMTKKVYTTNEEVPVNEVARLMNKKNINRVPIVNKQGVLVGIISRADIVRGMAKIED